MDNDDSNGTAGKAEPRIDGSGDTTHNATAQMHASLVARHTANALRRRALLAAGTTLVKRDPKDVAGAIALGFVLRGHGLGAADSWRLDGLLGESVDELVQRLTEASRHLPNGDAGAVLVRAIDLAAAELAAKGEYAAWKRRADRYFDEHDGWLAAAAEMRTAGRWRALRMTMGQQDLIRATCALLDIDLPGHLVRGSAHDWLDAARANLRYRGIGA
jgi:hypothetical protein